MYKIHKKTIRKSKKTDRLIDQKRKETYKLLQIVFCRYFFHYSGHGGQVKDEDGDDEDGFDETIMPIDFTTKGQIIDDELHAWMVAPLPKG